MLAEPALLLALVSEQLWDREPSNRLAQGVGSRTHHARKGRRHCGPQRDVPVALVAEAVQLADDLVPTLLRVQLAGLERRPIVFDEPEPARDVTPRLQDEGASGEFLWVEIAEPWKPPHLPR